MKYYILVHVVSVTIGIICDNSNVTWTDCAIGIVPIFYTFIPISFENTLLIKLVFCVCYLTRDTSVCLYV